MRVIRRLGPARESLRLVVQGFDGLRCRVGWFETTKYPDGTPVAYIALVHEFGVPSKKIPPRPFMRPTATAQTAQWIKLFEQGAKAVARRRETPNSVFEKMGLLVSGDIRKTIAGITSPALKPSTVKARQNRKADKTTEGNLTKPLFDTGVLLTSLTYTVEKA